MLPLYKCLKFFFRYLVPGPSRYFLARASGRIVIFFNRGRREVIVGNLTPLLGAGEARRRAPELLGNFLMTAVDFFCPRRNMALETPIENWSAVEKAYRKTKRVMLVTAHLGNWELGIPCLVEKGYSVSGIYAPYRGDDIVRWILSHRNTEVEWMPAARGAAQACIASLERGRVLGMVADIPFGEKGRRVSLAGARARMPLGPWAIAAWAKAVVFPAFIVREGPGRYRGVIHDPIFPAEAMSFRRQLESMQEIYRSHLEYYLKTYPTQWGCLQSYWDAK